MYNKNSDHTFFPKERKVTHVDVSGIERFALDYVFRRSQARSLQTRLILASNCFVPDPPPPPRTAYYREYVTHVAMAGSGGNDEWRLWRPI